MSEKNHRWHIFKRMMFSLIPLGHMGASAEVFAADLQFDPPAPYEECDALISGRIGEGDALRIIQQLSNSEIYVYYVCFNSEGGSYQEASRSEFVLIGEYYCVATYRACAKT